MQTQKMEKTKTTPIYKASIILMPKLDKDIAKRKKEKRRIYRKGKKEKKRERRKGGRKGG